MLENEDKEGNTQTDFNFPCDFLDDFDEEKQPNLTRKTTKKDINLLINFIGGFEKWSFLDEDCRIEVIKLLDYKSRVNISVCSKLDYEIVKKVPLKVDKIEIKDNEKNHYSLSSEEFANYPIEQSIIRSLPCCKYLRIGADSMDHFRWWLEKVPENLIDVSLSPVNIDPHSFILSPEILSLPQIMNALQFSFRGISAFTDDQLVHLKAKIISFDCVNITDDGINQFIKNWVSGKSVFDFKQLLLWSSQVRDLSRITRGLEMRPWDDDFRKEAFVFKHFNDVDSVMISIVVVEVDCYFKFRDKSRQSLTLCISDDCTSIYATGKRMTWGGNTYTNYSIPSLL
ncbi:hypothetical protein CRE_20292 [Caenorhabditis remanei]|uniref:Uncharacterized protein n=1 Tax=Caenorhabditis remanei TaxID=31234 RepID=E3MCK4_CAERE|nr:hypothetical protein CRE_20292 [Caenorhabditis remanei]